VCAAVLLLHRCVWCQKLAPTWEAFAETAEEDTPALRVVKVDCVVNHELCAEQKIHAFPTIRFFKNGKPNGYPTVV
jgi:thioredoxin-like negative regulator of GroEL